MKVGIKILGCPKNVADCEVLAGLLKKAGHEIVENAEDADVVIIDTCAFIEAAKRETIDTILDFVYYKKARPDLKIVVKGCMVQRYYRQLKSEIPEVDLWIGVVPPDQLIKALEDWKDRGGDPDPVYQNTLREDLQGKPYAYVKIADGCDRNCTFCAIPLFKGKYRSRPIEVLEEEVRKLVEDGKKEIVLVSQDNTAYGEDIYGKQSLPELLRCLNRIKGDFWIRVMYLHPDYLTEEIIDAIAHIEKVVPYFEVPIQHASNRILARMGRIKKSEELKRLFERIRTVSGEATIRTTVMVGFPGETEEDFEKLYEFIREVHPDRMGVFVYSDEEGTVASTFEDKVEEEVAKEREEIMVALSAELIHESNEKWIGRRIRVLTEEEEGEIIGRGSMDAPEIDGMVRIEGEVGVGEFVTVEVKDVEVYEMEGRVIG